MAQAVTAEELLEYLGADDSKKVEVERLRAAAVERLRRSTGHTEDNETFCEAVRVSVWLSYYGVRDSTKNTPYLQEYLSGLTCELQTSKEDTVE